LTVSFHGRILARHISKQKTSVEPPKPKVQTPPVEAPKPSLTFGESETVEFETDDEEEEERPKITLGEDIKVDLFPDEKGI
jgi:hypothetical protein